MSGRGKAATTVAAVVVLIGIVAIGQHRSTQHEKETEAACIRADRSLDGEWAAMVDAHNEFANAPANPSAYAYLDAAKTWALSAYGLHPDCRRASESKSNMSSFLTLLGACETNLDNGQSCLPPALPWFAIEPADPTDGARGASPAPEPTQLFGASGFGP